MKIYISVDIEGICGTTIWDDATRGKERYPEFQSQMTSEVSAACEGAFKSGATEIVIRDAHDSACNLIGGDLPKNTRLIRGWSRHPYMMMQGLDNSYDAALMIGYHSLAGGTGNPLAHTMSSRIGRLTINGLPASEFMINWLTAMYEKVPVAFISGDKEICSHAREVSPNIMHVAVKEGTAASTCNLHPDDACQLILQNVQQALSVDLASYLVDPPENFEVTISYLHHQDAYKASFYPGATLADERDVSFTFSNYFDVLRMFLFNL